MPLTAQGIAFTTDALTVAAGQPFAIDFDNQDVGVPHDVAIKDGTGSVKFKGETFPGDRQEDLRRVAARGRDLHVRLLGAREHDRDPDRPVIDRRPG